MPAPARERAPAIVLAPPRKGHRELPRASQTPSNSCNDWPNGSADDDARRPRLNDRLLLDSRQRAVGRVSVRAAAAERLVRGEDAVNGRLLEQVLHAHFDADTAAIYVAASAKGLTPSELEPRKRWRGC